MSVFEPVALSDRRNSTKVCWVVSLSVMPSSLLLMLLSLLFLSWSEDAFVPAMFWTSDRARKVVSLVCGVWASVLVSPGVSPTPMDSQARRKAF
ncbi:hypothetical protein BHS09_16845 [Myxococcus xanthus]|uniref:Uncharacterized protein n=1 Tax=Myxococcus xanthus TaxID=34 RepID=A0AAE6G0K4_MYXXA|nr:hypothetical protein BHS09_16845 [Myxococcus xanthus]